MQRKEESKGALMKSNLYLVLIPSITAPIMNLNKMDLCE